MEEEDSKPIDPHLFPTMHRVATLDDSLHKKIVQVLGDYVESQSFISDTIYIAPQERKVLYPLFPQRKPDISFLGFGPRPNLVQASVKVAPLHDTSPCVLSPPPPPALSLSVSSPSKDSTNPPTSCSKISDTQKEMITDSNHTDTTSGVSSLSVTPTDSGFSQKIETPNNQKQADEKGSASLTPKPLNENPCFSFPTQDVDVGEVIQEMTLPQIISPIRSPEVRMDIEVIVGEMTTDISPLSPISNVNKKDGKESLGLPSPANPLNGHSNISPHSVRSVLGDISSSSDEENKADDPLNKPRIERLPPCRPDLNTNKNVRSVKETKSGATPFAKSNEQPCTEIRQTKEPNNKALSSRLSSSNSKNSSKWPRPMPPGTSLSDSFRKEQGTPNDDYSNLSMAKTIPENFENRFTYHSKEYNASFRRPLPSVEALRFQRSQNKMKIAPPTASQIVCRPRNLIPLPAPNQHDQRDPSRGLRRKVTKTNHLSEPINFYPQNTQTTIGASQQQLQHLQQQLNLQQQQLQLQQSMIAPCLNGVSNSLSVSPQEGFVNIPNSSISQSERLTPKPVVITNKNNSPLFRSPKDVSIANKIDSQTLSYQLSLTSEKSGPNLFNNSSMTRESYEPLCEQSRPPYSGPKPLQVAYSHCMAANTPLSFLKGSPYGTLKKYGSPHECENWGKPKERSDRDKRLKNLAVSPYKLSHSSSVRNEGSFTKFKGKRLLVKIPLKLLTKKCCKQLCSRAANRARSPSFCATSLMEQRKKLKTPFRRKRLLVKIDMRLLSSVPEQMKHMDSIPDQRDIEPSAKNPFISSLLCEWRQDPEEMKKIERDVRTLWQQDSKSCYSRGKYFKSQAKIMKKEARMFLHLLAANWFALCCYQMEKEGHSLNSVRRHLDEVVLFLSEIGRFQDIRMEALRSLLRAVVCRKCTQLNREKRKQLKKDLNAEYNSNFALSFSVPNNIFQESLNRNQNKGTSSNNIPDKSLTVSYRFLALNKEYQSLMDLLEKSEDFLYQAKAMMQEKRQFFSLVQSRVQFLNICVEIPFVVDFVKTCMELLQPKELGLIIAAQGR